MTVFPLLICPRENCSCTVARSSFDLLSWATWAIRSHHSLQKSDTPDKEEKSISLCFLFLAKNEQLAQKTREQINNPVYFNPHKHGIPAVTKGRACWRFFSNYCSKPPPPPNTGRATSWRKNSNWFKPRLWFWFWQNSTKGGALEKKAHAGAHFLFLFCHFHYKNKVILKFL